MGEIVTTTGKVTKRKRMKVNYGMWTIPKSGVAVATFKNAKAFRTPDAVGIEWDRITRRITKDIDNDIILEDIRPRSMGVSKNIGTRNLDEPATISVIVEFTDKPERNKNDAKVQNDECSEKFSWADATDDEFYEKGAYYAMEGFGKRDDTRDR